MQPYSCRNTTCCARTGVGLIAYGCNNILAEGAEALLATLSGVVVLVSCFDWIWVHFSGGFGFLIALSLASCFSQLWLIVSHALACCFWLVWLLVSRSLGFFLVIQASYFSLIKRIDSLQIFGASLPQNFCIHVEDGLQKNAARHFFGAFSGPRNWFFRKKTTFFQYVLLQGRCATA